MIVKREDLRDFLADIYTHVMEEYRTGQYPDIETPHDYIKTCIQDLLNKLDEIEE